MRIALETVLNCPGPQDHVVQLYTDPEVLARKVVRYLLDGFEQGDSGLVIAKRAHVASIRANLESSGADLASAERNRKLLFLDTHQVLSRIMVCDRPDWERFEDTISAACGSLDPSPGRRVRAYGEIVDVLWTSGAYSAAITVEEYWNRILKAVNGTLFCAYSIDVFGPEFHPSSVHAILCDHTHLLPAEDTGRLEGALTRAMRQVLGENADPIASGNQSEIPPEWCAMPPAERAILWVRQNFPDAAPEVLRLARGDFHGQTSHLPG